MYFLKELGGVLLAIVIGISLAWLFVGCDNINPRYGIQDNETKDVIVIQDEDVVQIDEFEMDNSIIQDQDEILVEDADDTDFQLYTPDDDAYSVCGDGIVQGIEDCDDQNKDETDGCYSNCTTGARPKGNQYLPVQRTPNGWACDPDDWQKMIEVEIEFFDKWGNFGDRITGIVASYEDASLYSSLDCGGTGLHGWRFDMSNIVTQYQGHGFQTPFAIYVYAKDPEAAIVDPELEFTLLPGSPQQIW